MEGFTGRTLQTAWLIVQERWGSVLSAAMQARRGAAVQQCSSAEGKKATRGACWSVGVQRCRLSGAEGGGLSNGGDARRDFFLVEHWRRLQFPAVRGQCARASPIIHLGFSSELALAEAPALGRHGAGPAAHAALLWQSGFMTPDAGHGDDMCWRTISRRRDSDTLQPLPCVRLQWHPMRSASKIACAGRVGEVLAQRRPAGSAHIG